MPAGTKTVAPGDAYAGTAELAARLQLLGDLPQGGSFDSYSGALVDGVKHFQARHGLATDGRLDAATLSELNTPLNARVQQIDDALERWRWMPVEFQQPPARQHSGVSAKGLFSGSPACAQHESRCGQGRANPNAGVYRRHTVHRFPALLERPPWNSPQKCHSRHHEKQRVYCS